VRIRHVTYSAGLVAAFLLTTAAAAKCQLEQIGVMPVEMQGLRPMISTKINGVDARFVVDSGAFYSTISSDAAAQYRLPVTPAPGHAFYITGIGGSEKAGIATAESFEFLGTSLQNVRFLTIEQTFGSAAGLIGQNLLRISDVEFDLANGIVRFIKPVGCADQPLAYWAVSTPYSSVDLQYMDLAQSHLLSTAMVNGKRITVLFDSGASHSLLSLEAAQRLGITPDSPRVTFLGTVSGVGPGATQVWIAPVETFQIGGEKVEHTHVPIGKLGPDRPLGYVGDAGPDMLLGDDFFLSHRIYVAYSQKKLYFTYNGGPLFDLSVPQAASGLAKAPATPAAISQASATTNAQASSDAPTDAEGFNRRGMAYASMREFDRAIADLTRACDLAPGDAENRYQRGMIYFQDKQFKPALDDFNAAITLRPDDIDAHVVRAQLLQSQHDSNSAAAAAEIKLDLDAASRLAPAAAGVRLTLADLYGALGDYAAAVGQVDQWLAHHPLKNEQVAGLNDRCRLRATANQDLSEALDDCNHALNVKIVRALPNGDLVSTPLAGGDPHILDSRGLVHLRLGDLKDAIQDYDAALQANSSVASSLYGRGLAELRLGQKTQGQNDLGAAAKLDKRIAVRFAKMGLAP
jgi:tetratricopeptide (TPR) repeat protein/predicted aspartyl protease